MDHPPRRNGTPPTTEGAALLGGAAKQQTEQALLRIGALCGGCRRPTDSRGDDGYLLEPTPEFPYGCAAGHALEFVYLRTEVLRGQPTVVAEKRVACIRPDCEERTKLLERGPMAIREVSGFDVAPPRVAELVSDDEPEAEAA